MEALGINLPGLIGQMVNFLLLFGLLSLLVYRPVLRMLDERAARIRESIETAEAIRQQAARAQEEIQARLDEARREGQILMAQAERLGDQLKEEARQEARREAELILARARADFELEREHAVNELRREFVDLAISAAERVIRESLDRAKHERLIRDVLEQSRDLRRSS